ncbi:MAG: LAGLIDADG family homing endonuclease, partial [Promethearchaeota archaeon]
VQNALLTLGIISYIRKRQSKTTTLASGKKIIGRKVRFELTFKNFSDICSFSQNIGFNHPHKGKLLQISCQNFKEPHKNLNNIPYISFLLKEILDFYGYTSREVTERKRAFSLYYLKSRDISREHISKILSKVELNWHRHHVKIPYEIRNQFYQSIKRILPMEQIFEFSNLSKLQIYEYFVRKNRNPFIPIGVFISLLEKTKELIKPEIKAYWTNYVKLIRKKHEEYQEKFEFLKNISYSDIFWDEIKEVEEIIPTEPYVYDLTIPNSHNFVANGIIVHNTAAVLRDKETGDFALEAGALVLADRGIACLCSESKVLVNNRITSIEDLFEERNKFKARSGNEEIDLCKLNIDAISLNSNFETTSSNSSLLRRKRYTGNLYEINLKSGFKIKLTPEHKIIDGSTLEWKPARDFKNGDFIIAPLKIPKNNESIYLLDIIPNNWLAILEIGDKVELKKKVLSNYRTLSEFNRKYKISRDFLSGRTQIKVGIFRNILNDLGCYQEWRNKCLKYGRKAAGERLKVIEITPELAYFIGFVYGDGSVRISDRRSHISITQSIKNKAQIDQLKKMFTKFSKRNLGIYKRKIKNIIENRKVESENVILYIGSNLLAYIYQYITDNNFENLLKLPNQALSAFIAGCLDSDGCVSIKKGEKSGKIYETIHIDFLLSNNDDKDRAFMLALRRFNCFAKLIKLDNINDIRITGRVDIIQLMTAIQNFSVKCKAIPIRKHRVSSYSDKLPINQVSEISNQIISSINKSILLEKGIWSTLYAYKYKKYQPSREQLLKIKNRISNLLDKEVLNKIEILTSRNYFLDKILSINLIDYKGFVYDLYIPEYHNYLSEGIFVHNCLDEFDKMEASDRVAIHEAMEQQSYHYNTEIITTEGNRIKIGPFIDKLIEVHKNKIIQGVDCEILPYKDLELYSTDFQNIFKVQIDRISRHKAPDFFYRLKFTNGRTINVTPEHPIFVFRDTQLQSIEASRCKVGDFIPIPKYLPNSDIKIDLQLPSDTINLLSKEINLPLNITTKLARIMGYFITKGYSYKDSTAEIGLLNKDKLILNDFKKLMNDCFDIVPTVSRRGDGLVTLRYISNVLYNWIGENFPEMMETARFKRIPSKIMRSSKEIARAFLSSAFKGDGSVESTAICYRTEAKGLCEDYQDLLLKLGIQTRIILDKGNNLYKVYIRGQSLNLFFNEIIEENDPWYDEIQKLIKPREKNAFHDDIFPASISYIILNIKRNLGISDDGYYIQYQQLNYGITLNILEKEIKNLRNRYFTLKNFISTNPNLAEIRKKFYSQQKLADFSGLLRDNIDYSEWRGYAASRRMFIKNKDIRSLIKKIEEINNQITYLEKLKNADILWNQITKIEKIENKGKNYTPYVYDITVEPNHTFISQGVVLHNTISIAKAGIVATLNARTSILSAANPTFGRYDEYKTVAENIKRLPVTILSRFDLIFILRDRPEADRDSQMADVIIQSITEEVEPPIEASLLRKYIHYAKRTCFPTVSEDTAARLKEFYIEKRSAGEQQDAPVPITARQLGALIRLSQAHARMALRNEATIEDAEAAIRLLEYSLRQVGTDQETGMSDIDIIYTGQSKTQRDRLETLHDLIRDMVRQRGEAVSIENVLEEGERNNLQRSFMERAIEQLIARGLIYQPEPGKIRPVD